MYKTCFIFLFIFLASSFSQTKYFIYFKDKGVNQQDALNKNSMIYKKAESLLTKESIERRKKNMGENYILFEDLPVYEEYVNEIENSGVKVIHKLSWFNSISVFMNEEQKEIVKKFPFVDRIEPAKKIRYKRENYPEKKKSIKKNSIKLNLNYGESFEHLQLSDIPVVHEKGITGEGVIIGLLDTGFDWQTHEALQTRDVIAEFDFVYGDSITANEDEDRPTQDGHGTSVFSVIGGFKDGNLIGASFNSSFILAKTEDIRSETHVEEDNYAAALIWMENLGVDITSSSLGYSNFDPPELSYTYQDLDGNTTIITKACEEAFKRGVLTITSAGNEGNEDWYYINAPADGFNTIAVGAVHPDNTVTSFSSRGPTYDGRIKPDVVTQGTSVYGATSSGTYSGNFSGTSAAAPIASGVAGLLLSAHPHLTNVQLRNILIRTADNYYTPNNERGYGLLSAMNAISFPNLEEIEGNYKIHKIFFPKVNPGSAKIHLSNQSGFTEETLNFDGNFRYSYSLPSFSPGSMIEFYFTYMDSTGNSYREPANENYKLNYGNFEIILDVKHSSIPEDYVLSNNYPNPFNNRTRINFIASSNDKAELFIVDLLGQKVRSLFNDTPSDGVNIVEWNGFTDSGTEATSGIYYYVLKLNDKLYTNKMVFLK